MLVKTSTVNESNVIKLKTQFIEYEWEYKWIYIDYEFVDC